MRRLFSVSMPRAGHHVAEAVLGRLLGPRFAYCEFYTIANCCKQIPCARMAERMASGATAFMQKSHDHDLADPVDPRFDGLLVQVREPVARALSNYELDLATVGPPHTPSYMRFWLGLEAAYTVGFIEKWCLSRDARLLVLKYEDLLADPVAYYRHIFQRFGLPMAQFDETKVLAAQSVSSAVTAPGQKKPFRERDIRGSKHYDEASLQEFQALVAEAAERIGYRPHAQLAGGTPQADMRLAFEARRHAMAGRRDAALDALNRYLAMPGAHFRALRMRAGLLQGKGDLAGAERDLHDMIAAEPGHPRAYVSLAKLQQLRGQHPAAKQTLDRCLERATDLRQAATLILENFSDPLLIEAAQLRVQGSQLARGDVIAAFCYILGREPESDAVIEAHQRLPSSTALRDTLLRSAEFAEKYRELLGEGAH